MPTYNKNPSTLQSEGWTTADGVLAPEHDAAHTHWGGGWTYLCTACSNGYYWSSLPYSDYYFSWYLCFGSGYHDTYYGCHRYNGQSVRPVQGFTE